MVMLLAVITSYSIHYTKLYEITAPLLTQGVKVDLPEARAEPVENPDQEPVVVSVDAGGNLYLNVGDDPRNNFV